MSDVTLAHEYSAETYNKALDNLVSRWEQEKEGNPIKYDKAAIGMAKSTVSTTLKFLAEIGLLDSPKAGYYKVPENVVKYKNNVGNAQRQSKQKVAEMIGDYPVYDEATFLVGRGEFTLNEMTDEIAGMSNIAASSDEIQNVRRSIEILAELGFLQLDEEDQVSVPTDLMDVKDQKHVGDVATDNTSNPITENDTIHRRSYDNRCGNDNDYIVKQMGELSKADRVTLSSGINIDISINATKMDVDDLREKLATIDDVFNDNET